jgi:hypothetical protein
VHVAEVRQTRRREEGGGAQYSMCLEWDAGGQAGRKLSQRRATNLPTYDMRNIHQVVVHNRSEVVRREPVTFQQHLVVNGIVCKSH